MAIPQKPCTATGILEDIKAGDIALHAPAKASLTEIEKQDDTIKSFVHVDPDLAEQQVAAVSERWRDADAGTLPLAGVPVAIKDIIDTHDMPTCYGSPIYSGHRPQADAAVVHRLRQAGAIIIGKTATTEFALSHPAVTANPRDPRRTPGGSSSGSAAAVAAGMVPLAIGSQTSGSVLRPASFCGVFGFKPSFDAIPIAGVHELAKPLDHVGLFANSIDDIILLTRVLAPGLAHPTNGGKRRLRLGFIRTPVWDQATAEAQQAILSYIDARREWVEEIAFPEAFNDAAELQNSILLAHVALIFADLAATHPDKTSATLKARIADGKKIPATEILAATRRATALGQELDTLFADFDAVLSLPAAGVAPYGLDWTGNPQFTTIWTMLGLPTLSMPVLSGQSGLPIGLQVIGRRNHDGALLATAKRLLCENV